MFFVNFSTTICGILLAAIFGNGASNFQDNTFEDLGIGGVALLDLLRVLLLARYPGLLALLSSRTGDLERDRLLARSS